MVQALLLRCLLSVPESREEQDVMDESLCQLAN
jgi:hypothetical protein